MKLISKIEIKYYRSIHNQTISEINNLNIFSGGNDVGKSNVMRALDCFFNEKSLDFGIEFNTIRKSEITRIREKQIISIKVWFRNDTYQNLPSVFSIKKTWDKNGKIINTQDSLSSWLKNKQGNVSESHAQANLSRYLNRIKFRYIKAIKDDVIFNDLLVELYNAIVENNKGSMSEFEESLSTLNIKLSQLSEDLSNNFYEIAKIRSRINIPSSVNELARRLSVTTSTEREEQIPLFNRGDGIRMQYIPAILNFISNVEKNKWHIWAIDEPETSCEYLKAESLAKDFKNTYSKKHQIFLSSHSFSFITLKGDDISRYRVFLESGNSSIKQINDDIFAENELKDELGILNLLDGLQEVYDSFTKERALINENVEKLKKISKALLLFEGESDKILFKKAIKKLSPELLEDFVFSDDADSNNNSSIGEGVDSLYGFIYSHIPKISPQNLIIAIFDKDDAGVTKFKDIQKKNKSYEFRKINDYEVLKHKSYNVYALCICEPDFRKNFVNEKPRHCYLTTELLLSDNLIPKNSRDIVPNTNPQIFSFKSDNKISFANRISDDADFSGFKKTIDVFITIKNSINN